MQLSEENERRRCSRFGISFRVTAQEFCSTLSGIHPTSIHGQSRNVSTNGMCLMLDRACTVSSLLRCDVFLRGSPASIPTLARVHWIQNPQPGEFVAGVEFLL